YIPLYLRDVLQRCSASFVESPNTYVHMLQTLANDEPHDVAIITTNYDTLIESALVKVTGASITTMDGYLENRGGVKLFKLHGSVNWFTPIGEGRTSAQGFRDNWWKDLVHSLDLDELGTSLS